VAEEVFPASVPPLGFGAFGGAPTAAMVGGIEYEGVGEVAEGASIGGIASAATRRRGFGDGAARRGREITW
jgi:hypothetical protein